MHAAVAAVLGAIALRHRDRVPALPVDEPLLEVTLIEPTGAGSAASPGSPAGSQERALPGPARIVGRGHSAAATGTGTGTSTGTEPGRGTATGHQLMKMRGPELHGVALSFDPDKHPLPPPIEISGRMQDAGRSSVIHDRVTTVTVAQDGTAHFHDKPDLEAHVIVPIMSREQFGNMLRKWYEDPYAQRNSVGRTQEMAPVDQAVEGTWNSGLTPSTGGVPDKGGGGTIPLVGGSFDLTAWAMRKAGAGDPYQARKRALLDSTRAERAERGGSYRAEQLAKSAEIMRGNLEQLWRSTSDAAERRVTLFQLWDECVEGEGPQAEAGQRARSQVLGWIRAKLPADGAGAFTPAEIAALDAKRSSKQHFCPYESRQPDSAP